MTHEGTTSAPSCYRHPDRDTFLSCSRCARPICSACSTDATVGQRCPECLRQEGTQKVIPARRALSSPQAPVTRALIGVAAVMFVLTLGGGLRATLFESLAHVNFLIAEGEWWRVFTPVLLHDGITHILFNMWALWVLGPQIERGVGTAPFLAAYLAAAAVGGAFVFYLGSPQTVAVGASGAIFGLFGIWSNWAVHRRNTVQGRALLRQMGFLLLLNAALPLIIPNIAWEAHLGGLIAGFLIGEGWSRIPSRNAVAMRTGVAVVVAVLAVVAILARPPI